MARDGTSSTQRSALAVSAALALAAGLGWSGFIPGSPQDATSPETAPLASLLAVGDTGAPPGWFPSLGGQRAVGAGLAHEDARSPVDALVLLGDNFYESGLRSPELVSRVRENVVAPYCRFVDLAAPRSAEVRVACSGSEARHPAPRLFAVLGNHDLASRESPALQAEEVARFVANWDLSAEPARSVLLSPRLSLVLFDSNYLQSSDDRVPLRDALRASTGPWRILAAHHPIGTRGRSADGDAYEHAVRRAVEEAGVSVQLMLAGHEHNLQLVALDDPGPRLVVVSGAGARPRSVNTRSPSRLFSFEGLGFARIDLLPGRDGERLRVTLFAAPRWASLFGLSPEVLGRWSLGSDDAVQVEPLAIHWVEEP